MEAAEITDADDAKQIVRLKGVFFATWFGAAAD
jgi:hypothetical protein